MDPTNLLGSRAYVKPVKKQNDLRLVVMLVSGLYSQKMKWFSSVIEEIQGKPVTVTVYGAASEKITLSDGQVVTTDSTGKATVTVRTGKTYTLKGSVSGYTSKQQTVIDNATKLYAMPEGALYWYGNECAGITGGWTTGTASSYFSSASKNTNCVTVHNTNNDYFAWCRTNQKILSSNYENIVFVAALSADHSGSWSGLHYSDTTELSGYQHPSAANQTEGGVITTNSTVLPENKYVNMTCSNSNNGHTTDASFYAVWLE